ncbi:hypothetical protein ES705_41181 [subsurface metagenome]
MTSRQRLITTLDGGKADRLPVTTHHIMPYFLDKYMDGISNKEFFDFFNMDAITWPVPVQADTMRGEYLDPSQGEPGFLQVSRVLSDNWRIESEEIADPRYKTTRYTITTPGGQMSCVIQGNDYTEWVGEALLKKKTDIELIANYGTRPLCNTGKVQEAVHEMGDRGIVRGFILPFDIFGQPDCWQDGCCIRGAENLIMDSFDDPVWVHELMQVLLERKMPYVKSMKGSGYDLMELGGGDASTTVISPTIFNEFVAPYGKQLIDEAHKAGIRVSYHVCGGMMPILEDLTAMGPDALETFTPPEMGADVDLAEAKRRIGDKVCMIGGFNQAHYLQGCTEKATRDYVRKCFDEAGAGGGYILAPSDHFFDADINLLKALADEAAKCLY